MARPRTVTLVALVGVLAGVACSSNNTLEARFAREEKCEGSVDVRSVGNGHYVAEGCGKRTEYVCYARSNAHKCQRYGLPPPPGSSVGPAREFPPRTVEDQPGRPPGE